MIDLHSHILPSLDDGARNMEEALEMARVAEQDGIKKIVATPHVFRHPFIYKDLDIIEKKWRELTWILKENDINVDILLGAEVHIFHDLMNEIRKNRKPFVIHQSSYMIVEFPPHNVVAGIIKLFFDLLSEGIIPIISHPERNLVFQRNPELLFKLIQMGGLSQANSGSFSRYYGRRVQETAYYFLEMNLIHFIGSDCHSPRSNATKLSEAACRIKEVGGEEIANALVLRNPLAVLYDREIPYFPDPISPKENEKSFKIKIPNIFNRRS